MRELDKLGQALTALQLKDMTWVIEGHTDAAGGNLYNQALSEEWAQAAREYLIA
ncbi:OmpA family protein [Thiospirillum jenense]|uniref:OmpA family protein n=1 Tax=Thiospirillum jenense TaxID=1653858 RepID=A0A839HGX5_9GAMM|nr:OmpA family protein [Thiospirillum jenense]MBB1127210.1 OmpA family protein [Thiospirillum jenense]